MSATRLDPRSTPVAAEFIAARRRDARLASTLPPPKRDSDFAALVSSMGGRWGYHPNDTQPPPPHKIGLVGCDS